ncbi:hypothetical protein N2152v2_003919 [Parachlorella kessleri]
MARQTDWDHLLLASEDLVLREGQGFPRVERDVLQVEQFSQKLRAKAARVDATSEALDASRLLAQEGLNPRRLNQALQTLQLRPTYEDVFQVETSTVDEYLQQVHQSITTTAVQQAQRSTAAAFEQFMDRCLHAKWEEEKRALLESVGPYSAAAGGGAFGARTPGPSPGGYLSPYARTPSSFTGGAAAGTPGRGGGYHNGGTPLAGRTPGNGSLAADTPLVAGGLQLRGRAARYAEVVRKVNQATANRQTYEAVGDFAAACADDSAGDKRTSIHRVWQVLQHVLGSGGVLSLPAVAKAQRTEALLAGAVKYLEESYVAYMQNVVQTHRMQAALGGSPSRLGLVQAFLRVREKERGLLDFDQPGGVDTTWQRIYCCLRAGFHAEALQASTGSTGLLLGREEEGRPGKEQCLLQTQFVGLLPWGTGSPPVVLVARGSKEVATPRAGATDFGRMLQEWAEGGGRPLSGRAAADLTQECERLLRDRAARARQPFYAQRLMAHALLCGNNHAAEQDFPAFFSTIEDFLWFKLRLVRVDDKGPSASVGAGYYEVYTLADLQQYLQQYPPGHYSHNGKEPLLYVLVLLLSLQFRAAVDFLAQEASTRDYRLDAVHLGICLLHYGVLGASGEQDAGAGARGLDPGTLIHRYGREFLYTDAELALEYYMLASEALGGSTAVKGQLLRELLVESKAYGFLLGGGGAGEGGALARFMPDAAERGRVLEAVAQECAAAAQLEEAVELYMFAGRPRHALRILNHCLADLAAAQAGPTGAAAAQGGEDAATVISRGNAAAAAITGGGGGGGGSAADPADLAEVEAFEQLKVILDLLAASSRGDQPRVLQRLGDLPFIPTERFRLQVRAAGVTSLHPAVAQQLPAVLLAAATALARARQQEQLRTVVAFAAAVPGRIPQGVYQQLNQLQASLG